MTQKITILNRTDNPSYQIRILSRNPADQLPNVCREVREHLLNRHERFKIQMTPSESLLYLGTFRELPAKLVEAACAYKSPDCYNDHDYLRRSVRQFAGRITYTPSATQIEYNIQYLTTFSQEQTIDSILTELFSRQNVHFIQGSEKRIRFSYHYIL